MRYVVHKHPLSIGRDNLVRLPYGTSLIHFGFQDRTPTVWSCKPVETYGWFEWRLRVVGTGHEFDVDYEEFDPPRHVGTAFVDWFVWHLFVLEIAEVEYPS